MKLIIHLRPLFSSTLAVLAAGSCVLHGTVVQAQGPATISAVSTQESAQSGQELAAWRTQREQQLAVPDGWLTLVGLEWLKPGINSFGSAADNQIRVRAQAPEHMGLLTVSGEPPQGKSSKGKHSKSKPATRKSANTKIVQLLAPTGGFPPEMKLDGNPAREGPLVVEGVKPSTISWRGLTLVVLKRGDRFVLRIKDAAAPTRTGFHGLNWYVPNPSYQVTAKWIPFTPPRIEKIPTVLGTTLDLPSPGVAEFTLDGKTLRLEPVIEDPRGQTLFFILRDETSKTTTYGGGRFLHTGLPDHGLDQPGHLTLDFNRLENPPCAYTPYATCPLPPEQNRLPISLEAGERRFAN